MTEDARFADGAERPLRLKALDADDLSVIAALCQDAVLPASQLVWRPRERRFGALLNRFRWEDRERALARGRAVERVQSVMMVEDVQAVRSQGIPRGDADIVLSLLGLDFAPGPDGTGTLTLTFAGDGAIALEVEALEVVLRDVTRPYRAPSGQVPRHDA